MIRRGYGFALTRFNKLGWTAGFVVLCSSIPLIFVLLSSTQLSIEQWTSLWSKRLPELLWNTLSLATLVAIVSLVLGISSAWLISYRRFPGQMLAVWLMVLPLSIPTYVFAHIYTSLTEPDSGIGQAWIGLFGDSSPPPDLYNLGGATLILSLAGFSYIFLLVRAALYQSHKTLEEAARLQGLNSLQIFWRVNLPLLRPAIAAGLALIILHVLSDFGAVSMLHFQTFTLSIYTQMSGRMDYHAAAGLSLVLVALSLSFLVLERFFRNQQRYYSNTSGNYAERPVATPKETLFIWSWIGLIAFFSFLLPLFWMISWSWQAWQQELIDNQFWEYTLNTGVLAFSVATITLMAGFPVAFFHAQKHTFLSQSFLHLSNIGFVLPGPVIALGVLSFILAVLPIVYGTLIALLIALIIRFLPLAVTAQEAALQQLTPSILNAGRIFGKGPMNNLQHVILPIIRGGLASAWVLVFIDALKELPATLLLRPTGFDTLPVRIWIEASEEMLELAAPAALTLVIGTLPAIWLMIKSERNGIRSS